MLELPIEATGMTRLRIKETVARKDSQEEDPQELPVKGQVGESRMKKEFPLRGLGAKE